MKHDEPLDYQNPPARRPAVNRGSEHRAPAGGNGDDAMPRATVHHTVNTVIFVAERYRTDL